MLRGSIDSVSDSGPCSRFLISGVGGQECSLLLTNLPHLLAGKDQGGGGCRMLPFGDDLVNKVSDKMFSIYNVCSQACWI